MKKILMLSVLVSLLVIVSLAMVSAVPLKEAVVAGKIYNADWSSEVKEADVNVTCGITTKPTTSGNDGTYSVKFIEADNCNYNSEVSVHAICTGSPCEEVETGNPVVGENTVEGKINVDGTLIGINANLGVVNVPLIPEFGFFVGTLTLLSALGVFFLVRRK